jgi:hypothetical protein
MASNNGNSSASGLKSFLNSSSLPNELFLSLSLMLRPTVSQPVCPVIKHPSGAYDLIFIIVWQLWVCWFGAPSLTRGQVCHLQLLLALASAVIFGSKSCRTHGHILLSQIRDFPFRRLLQIAGSRWRYSTPPPHYVCMYVCMYKGWARNPALAPRPSMIYVVCPKRNRTF